MKWNNKISLILMGLIIVFYVGYSLIRGSHSITENGIVFDYDINVDSNNKIVSYLPDGILNSELLGKISSNITDSEIEFVVYDINGVEKTINSTIATGDKLILKYVDGANIAEYTMSVLGDVDGNGMVDNLDVDKLFNYYKDELVFEEQYLKAGDVKFTDGNISLENNKIVLYPSGEYEFNYVVFPNNNNEIKLADIAKLYQYINAKIELDYYSKDAQVSITNNDSNIIELSNNRVKGLSVGTSSINLKTKNGSSATIDVIVKGEFVEVTSISFADTSINLSSVGETKTLGLNIEPSNATDKNIVWSSSDTSVATVNSSGVVTAVNSGIATITATTSNGLTATISVMVDIGEMKLLKDTTFENGFEVWIDQNEKSYMCVNCKDQQYWYIASWGFEPKFVNVYEEDGYYKIDAEHSVDVNNKLIAYNNQGEMHFALNTFGYEYSSDVWPHLLLDGMAGTNNKFYDFYSYNELEQKYYSFTNNDIWYHVDLRLDYYTKGEPINDVLAAQYLSFLELRDKETGKAMWFGFNLFDDRECCQGDYSGYDSATDSFIYTIGTDKMYSENSIYNDGNLIYGEWKSIDVNLSDYVNDFVDIANEKQFFGRTITEDDLFVSALNIGFEIHGEYHIGMSMKNLNIISKKR